MLSFRTSLIALVLCGWCGCGDSASDQSAGGQGGGENAGGQGGGEGGIDACISTSEFGRASTIPASLFLAKTLATDVDGDEDVDVIALSGGVQDEEWSIAYALNTGRGIDVTEATVDRTSIVSVLHPAVPTRLVEVGDDYVRWLDLVTLEDTTTDCPALPQMDAARSLGISIDIDADGNADVLGVSNGSLFFLSVSDTDPCDISVRRATPEPYGILTVTPVGTTPREVWIGAQGGIYRLVDGQGVRGGEIVAELLSEVRPPFDYGGILSDVDGDGELELLGLHQGALFVVEVSGSTWSYSTHDAPGGDVDTVIMAARDLDCDGDQDIVTNRRIWVNDGGGTFSLGAEFPSGALQPAVMTDFTGDGATDFLMTSSSDFLLVEGLAPGD